MDFGVVQAYLGAIRSWPWADIRSVAELALYYLTVIAILGCLMRLNAIGRILRDFREARGPLWELKTTVSDLKDLEPAIQLLGDKVEAARKQVVELQAERISTRSDTNEAEGIDQADETEAPAPAEPGADRNWLQLREYWQRNRKRVEYIIDQIEDGRTKLAYDRLPRTNYRRILNKLQGQRFITAAAANASRELNDLFNKYRPRNQTIPDEVIGSLQVLDRQLDQELVPFARVLAAESSEDAGPDDQPPTRPRPGAGRPAVFANRSDEPGHLAH